MMPDYATIIYNKYLVFIAHEVFILLETLKPFRAHTCALFIVMRLKGDRKHFELTIVLTGLPESPESPFLPRLPRFPGGPGAPENLPKRKCLIIVEKVIFVIIYSKVY